jgi:hypothetical protein
MSGTRFTSTGVDVIVMTRDRVRDESAQWWTAEATWPVRGIRGLTCEPGTKTTGPVAVGPS